MKTLGLPALIASLLTLTACGGALPDGATNSTAAGQGPVRTLLIADRAMATDQVSFQKTSVGGLIASLFVQPRASMAAPDTQTVGCTQAGQGALGIDAYLSQPTWNTRSVLLTGLSVPTRNFSLGFPVADAALPVKSYFVIDARGFLNWPTARPRVTSSSRSSPTTARA